jgi:hypothetical protein
MERGIKAGNLEHAWQPIHDCTNWGKVVGLVQMREGDQLLKPIENRISDDDGRSVDWSAVNDAVADCHGQPSTDLLTQEGHELGKCSGHRTDLYGGPCCIDEALSADTFGREAGACTNALDQSLHTPLEPVARRNLEQLELDA